MELKKSELVPENRQSLYQEIIACVKEPIIQYAGTSALPKFVLVRKAIIVIAFVLCRVQSALLICESIYTMYM